MRGFIRGILSPESEEEKYEERIMKLTQDTCKFIYSRLKEMIIEGELERVDVYDFAQDLLERIDMVLGDYLDKLYEMKPEKIKKKKLEES